MTANLQPNSAWSDVSQGTASFVLSLGNGDDSIILWDTTTFQEAVAQAQTDVANLYNISNTIQANIISLSNNINSIQSNTQQIAPSYYVNTLPSGIPFGSLAYANNGLKIGETTTHGTGVLVFFSSNGSINNWLVVGTNIIDSS